MAARSRSAWPLRPSRTAPTRRSAAFLAERLGVTQRDVTLVSGARSRAKRFSVSGAADAARLLPG